MVGSPDRGGYSVSSIARPPVILVTITGSLTIDDVERLGKRQIDLVRTLGFLVGRFDVLLDASGSPIQPVLVGDAIGKLVPRDGFSPARLAIVHGDAPVKMQLRRVNAGKEANYFTTIAEAMTWLTNGAADTDS